MIKLLQALIDRASEQPALGRDFSTGRTVPIKLSGPASLSGEAAGGSRTNGLTLQEEEAGRTVMLAYMAHKRRKLRRQQLLWEQQQQQVVVEGKQQPLPCLPPVSSSPALDAVDVGRHSPPPLADGINARSPLPAEPQ